MSRMAERGVFTGSAGPDEARELFAFTQALNLPVEDGSHLARVVKEFAASPLAALQRRASGL
jgi:hypothetical protein